MMTALLAGSRLIAPAPFSARTGTRAHSARCGRCGASRPQYRTLRFHNICAMAPVCPHGGPPDTRSPFHAQAGQPGHTALIALEPCSPPPPPASHAASGLLLAPHRRGKLCNTDQAGWHGARQRWLVSRLVHPRRHRDSAARRWRGSLEHQLRGRSCGPVQVGGNQTRNLMRIGCTSFLPACYRHARRGTRHRAGACACAAARLAAAGARAEGRCSFTQDRG